MAFNPYNIFGIVPLFVLRTMAKIVAWVISFFPNVSINNSVRKNLILAYPQLDEQQRKHWQNKIVKNQCITAIESIKSWAMPPKWSIQQIKKVYNQELLTAGLNNPNGMLAIVPHLGTWEVMNAWLNQHGSPTIMYKPLKNKMSNDFLLQGRQKLNATLVPTDASGVKAVFKTLKSGGFSIVLPDHVPDPSGGVVVPFFGIPIMSSTLAPKLASKTKCSLVGIACIRREDNKGFDIHCYKLDEPALYSKDIILATATLNNVMQEMIEPFKEHYMWGYRRFKYVPNINNVYKLTDDELIKQTKHYTESRTNTESKANTESRANTEKNREKKTD